MKCPGCGGSVADDEYFCRDCGEALFPAWGTPHMERSTYPPHEPAVSARTDGTPAPPVSEAGLGYQSGHTAPQGPDVRPTARKIPWGSIRAAVAVVIIVAAALSLYFVFRSPDISVSPPQGWTEASAAEMESFERSLREENPEGNLVAMYYEEDYGSGRILITSRGANDDGEIPETTEIAEIERYIQEMGQTMSPEEMEYLEDMDAVMLGCGLAGLYQATEGGDLNHEVLSVRKKNRVFTILYFTREPQGDTPSPVMQHFIATISFN